MYMYACVIGITEAFAKEKLLIWSSQMLEDFNRHNFGNHDASMKIIDDINRLQGDIFRVQGDINQVQVDLKLVQSDVASMKALMLDGFLKIQFMLSHRETVALGGASIEHAPITEATPIRRSTQSVLHFQVSPAVRTSSVIPSLLQDTLFSSQKEVTCRGVFECWYVNEVHKMDKSDSNYYILTKYSRLVCFMKMFYDGAPVTISVKPSLCDVALFM